MILPYNEYLAAATETYVSLHKQFNYSLKHTFLSLLGDFNYADEYSEIDELCFSVFFAYICINNNKNISFMQKKLEKFEDDEILKKFRNELGSDYSNFEMVLKKIKAT